MNVASWFAFLAVYLLVTVVGIVMTTNMANVGVMVDRIDRAAANADGRILKIEGRLDGIEADIEALVGPIVELAKSVDRLENSAVAHEEDVSCLYGAFSNAGVFIIVYDEVGPPPPELTDMYLCGGGQRFYTFMPDGAAVGNPLAAPGVNGGLN